MIEWSELEVLVGPEELSVRERTVTKVLDAYNHVVVVVKASDSSPKLDFVEGIVSLEDGEGQLEVHAKRVRTR